MRLFVIGWQLPADMIPRHVQTFLIIIWKGLCEQISNLSFHGDYEGIIYVSTKFHSCIYYTIHMLTFKLPCFGGVDAGDPGDPAVFLLNKLLKKLANTPSFVAPGLPGSIWCKRKRT